MNKRVKFICHAAFIAALYVVLTYLAAAMGLANNAIQVRFSEALCILPYFTPVAIGGLFCGCIISNLLMSAEILDVIFGSLATLLAAIFSYGLRKNKYLVPLPPIISNMLIIPPILANVYGVEGAMWFLAVTVGAGEVISCYILGLPLLFALDKYKNKLFK